MRTGRSLRSSGRIAAASVSLAVLLAPVAACGLDDGANGGSGDGSRADVVVSFYPLEFLVDRLGGDAVNVVNLTAPGVEPHDLELKPRDVALVADADLTVYLSGFQPAVDAAIAEADSDRTLDVATDAGLTSTATALADTGNEPGSNDEATSLDPHFWLDPERFADVAAVVARRLERVAPDQRSSIEANLSTLQQDLTGLDRDFTDGLVRCENRELVTSHASFGYLAERYGLRQVGITGLSPESEPSADRLAKITDYVRKHGISTIYFETLLSPALAETIATETGAGTAVLDPLEGITDASDGDDYLGVMRSNLRTLRRGQGCT